MPLVLIPKRELAIVIDSTQLAESMKKIFEALRMIAKKTDINSTITRLLTK